MKKFYDSLAEGRIMGLRCGKCGAYAFPPKTTCPSCLGRDLEWTEMSGEGKLLYLGSSAMPAEPYLEYAPYAYGLVKLKEGPVFYSMVAGIDVSDPSKIRKAMERLPLDVEAVIKKVAGLDVVTFKVK